jgi:hypothetical protein
VLWLPCTVETQNAPTIQFRALKHMPTAASSGLRAPVCACVYSRQFIWLRFVPTSPSVFRPVMLSGFYLGFRHSRNRLSTHFLPMSRRSLYPAARRSCTSSCSCILPDAHHLCSQCAVPYSHSAYPRSGRHRLWPLYVNSASRFAAF